MSLIWASRGRAWGFRFLLSGTQSDPLPEYDSIFANSSHDSLLFTRVDHKVGLRFPDPLHRRDSAGRVIPHEFVVYPPLADQLTTIDDGLALIWPTVEKRFAEIWAEDEPPTTPE